MFIVFSVLAFKMNAVLAMITVFKSQISLSSIHAAFKIFVQFFLWTLNSLNFTSLHISVLKLFQNHNHEIDVNQIREPLSWQHPVERSSDDRVCCWLQLWVVGFPFRRPSSPTKTSPDVHWISTSVERFPEFSLPRRRDSVRCNFSTRCVPLFALCPRDLCLQLLILSSTDRKQLGHYHKKDGF